MNVTLANVAMAIMAETNNASDHSLLWGYPIEVWDAWGIRALIWGAVLGVFALLLTAASAYILYRVADVAQKGLETESKSSAEKIAELTVQSDKLRKDTADANARAAEAQLALERFKKPRSIDPADAPRFVAEVSKLAGTDAAVYIIGEGPEPNNLGGALTLLLKQARWNVNSWVWTGAGALVGILVTYDPNGSPAVPMVCAALAKALNSAGLDAVAQPWPGPKWREFGGMLNGPNPPDPAAAPIRIIVGSKPQ